MLLINTFIKGVKKVSNDILLEIRNISKSFGVTRALEDISIEIKSGVIHSLLGRNGAGKSTLVNIIAGVYPQTSGDIFFEEKNIKHLNIFQRQELGIRLVPQHESSIPFLSVAENIFLGVLPKTKCNFVDWKSMNTIAKKELEEYGLDIDPTTETRKLSSIDARKLNIIRAMHGGAKLIILDEPTTALSNREREDLFSFINRLKDEGTAFIFISHYLGETIQLSDEITVIRDGHMFSVNKEKGQITDDYLANLVAGEDVRLTRRQLKSVYKNDDKIFECKNICGHCLNDISFDIYKGEILGIVGFPESGAREICRTLFGVNKIESGKIFYKGKKLQIKSPKDAIKEGLAYISYDRHREGFTPQFTVNYNIGMTITNSKLKKPFGFIDFKKERVISEKYKELLKIKCNFIDDLITQLSGGNQQKVVVSRSLSADPILLMLDEPTIGIDVKSREEIISTINEMTKNGMSVIYLTNDFEELLRVADRLLFFKDSKIIAEAQNESLSIVDITQIRDQRKEN